MPTLKKSEIGLSVGMLEEALVMQHAEGGDLELDQNSNSVRALRYSTGAFCCSFVVVVKVCVDKKIAKKE